MHHALLSNNRQGYTLIEMVVTLAIVSILATMALPYAKMGVIRQHEFELKEALREIRSAIDHFHIDWQEGRINKLSGSVSKSGYPTTLQILVEGVPLAGQLEGKKKYLRRIPLDPFNRELNSDLTPWHYVGYRDGADAQEWNEEDVYDIRSRSEKQALNKSNYRDW